MTRTAAPRVDLEWGTEITPVIAATGQPCCHQQAEATTALCFATAQGV